MIIVTRGEGHDKTVILYAISLFSFTLLFINDLGSQRVTQSQIYEITTEKCDLM